MAEPVPPKLIVLGDSGVYGWGDGEHGGWCERLRRHWMGLPGGPVLYNLGVRGDGIERLAARLGAEVSSRGELRRQRPQGLLLGIGLNDSARVGRADGRHQLAPWRRCMCSA
jgi:lysophospholipase L1-like esterase